MTDSIADTTLRPRFRRELVACWGSLSAIGYLWTIGLVVSHAIVDRWWLLCFLWASVCFVGYVMNGVLVSTEWFWAAGALLLSTAAVFLAGPSFYWLLGLWMGGTMVLAGLVGRRKANQAATAI